MKILILTNNDVGLYQFRRELVFELLKDNRVLISCPNGELIKPFERMGCIFIDTPVDRRGVNPKTDIKLFYQYVKLLWIEKPDLVITYTIKPNIYGGLASRMLGISHVTNITGLGTAFQNKGILRNIVTIMYKVGIKNAKTVFFENEENCQVFIEKGIVSKEKVCLLMGAGVNLEHYSVTSYPLTEGTRFLFMGRVMKEKGINELFEAMHRLYMDGIACTLDILGGCEEDYKEIIKKYETEGWINYYGYQKDVRPFINNCHCFVLPSWHEGMANTNLESAASGRPVITSNIHGCLEAVEDGISGYLAEEKNPGDLYRVMKKFTELSYTERKAMGLAGRKRMEELFDKKKVVADTIKQLLC